MKAPSSVSARICLAHKSPMLILAFLLVRPLSTSLSFHPCLLFGRPLVHKRPISILAFLLVGLLSKSIPFSFLRSFWLGCCPQVSHFHHCLLIIQALVPKSPMFILAFLLVGLLSTNVPFSSLPSYWLGSCPQVCHVHPCLLIGRALILRSPMLILIFTHLMGVLIRRILVKVHSLFSFHRTPQVVLDPWLAWTDQICTVQFKYRSLFTLADWME